MRNLYVVLKRSQQFKDEFDVSIHPVVLAEFKKWNDKRLHLLKIKQKPTSDLWGHRLTNNDGSKSLWDFQTTDVEFMVEAEQVYNANEMGTGKTVESAVTLDIWRERHPEDMKHGLIICPSTLVTSWRDHILDWTSYKPDQILLANQASLPDRLAPLVIGQHEVFDGIVITPWETLRNDTVLKLIQNFEYSFIIADEIHRARNLAAKQSANFIRTKAASKRKIGLSGTGVVNYGGDLYAIVHWLRPDQYDNFDVFNEDFVENPTRTVVRVKEGKMSKAEVDALEQELDYLMVRREKKDVLKDLPELIQTVVNLELYPEQRKLYNQMRDNWILSLTGNEEEVVNAKVVIAQLMRLKQLAVSPALIQMTQDTTTFGHRVFPYKAIEKFDYSVKLDWLMNYLENEVNPGDKVIVFSQWATTLKLLEARIRESSFWRDNHYGWVTITSDQYYQQSNGAIKTIKDTHDIESIFNNEPDAFLALSTLKKGGEGLTLTGGNHVVETDQWWNPATMDQAEGRAHRGGQTKTVYANNLVAENTVEQKILGMLSSKTNTFNTMIRSKQMLLKLLQEDKEKNG